MDNQASDSELLELWGAGDRRAASELLARHSASIVRFFQNKVWNGYEDLAQQTFVACVEARKRFRGDSSFRTFLFGIANNVLRSHLRSRARRPDFACLREMCVEDIGPGPSTLTRDRSEHDFLLAALRRIPVDYQIVLELYYWEELRAIAIAEIVELSESTVRTRIRRGRQLLDRAMTELAASPDEYLMIKQDLDKFARSIVWEPTPIEEALPILEESEET